MLERKQKNFPIAGKNLGRKTNFIIHFLLWGGVIQKNAEKKEFECVRPSERIKSVHIEFKKVDVNEEFGLIIEIYGFISKFQAGGSW